MVWLRQFSRLVLHIWPDRHRQRRKLRDMDDDQLRDIGISRSAAMREGRKPFWRQEGAKEIHDFLVVGNNVSPSLPAPPRTDRSLWCTYY